MKKLIGFILSIASLSTLAACGNTPDTWVVLTSSGYEPYEMVNEQGELIGFDIDLMHAIADEIGVEITWNDVNFDGILASLQAGQADLAIAGISPTEERAQSVDFSDVYYSSVDGLENYLVFESSDAFTSLADLTGGIIGTQLGTVQQELMDSLAGEFDYTVETRTVNAQLIEEIKNGLMDGMVVESLVADSILESNPNFSKVLIDESLDGIYGSAMAFPKDSDLVSQVNDALATLKENGTVDELITKWFE